MYLDAHCAGDKILQKNKENGLDPLSYCIEKAGESTELGQYLKQFEGTKDFSLKTISDNIQKGEGDLDDNETLLMMLDQLMQEKV